ncbi:MAG TPA: MarR family winged helix-turn-helix transcriptional regulator [Quisquiliibacterium sp.]|nr:MAG: MarR family transcriptional regulator [Burkholderiaceae bacterium]HOA93732.1 MarR family winged helix-turn-helix transcriptional regulator [Quisquiliibacterium sp.]HPA89440.1 MarR family winged helix-turn-helix transcriptional regulator [Quisquiliibacterium sp.]HQD82471.1 MarR family winged helix-turn-helix transcriptional regulator [Quisquiliibacterium sp.]HQN13334.1 MarR family winged helix-turn-helix transcriptional regulator [Quisquiliibacterium sp.]
MSEKTARPQGCTNFKLRQLLRHVSRLYDAELAAVGLKGTQYSMLSHIVTLGPIQPGELARRMGMDASTLTRNLRLLVDQGWAVQGPGQDARSRLIEITPAGRALHATARRHWKKAQLAMNEAFGVERVMALHALIDHGLDVLADGEDAAPDHARARASA